MNKYVMIAFALLLVIALVSAGSVPAEVIAGTGGGYGSGGTSGQGPQNIGGGHAQLNFPGNHDDYGHEKKH